MSLRDELKMIFRSTLTVPSEKIDAILALPAIADALALKAAVDNEPDMATTVTYSGPSGPSWEPPHDIESYMLNVGGAGAYNDLLARLRAIKAQP